MSDGQTSVPRAGQRRGLWGLLLPAALVGIAFGAGVAAVDAVVTHFDGSYLALGIVGMVAAFWAGAAGVAGLVLASVVAAVLWRVKKDFKYAIAPACVIAAGFALHAIAISGIIDNKDGVGRELLLNPIFIAAWGALLGALTGALAVKRAGRSWMVYGVVIASILVSSGIAPYVPDYVSAFALIVGPLILIAVGGALLDLLRSGAAAGATTLAFAAACGVALCLVARTSALRPLTPIERPAPRGVLAGAAASRPNVILIVIDTLRADHTTLDGYKYPTTPSLAKFAADCQVYTQATSVDSCTLPSHAAMFTGLYPRENGAHADTKLGTDTIERYRASFVGISPAKKTLATYLSEEGYATAGITANYARLCRQFGFDQGFQYYYDIPRLCLFTRGDMPEYRIALDAVDRLLGYDGKLLDTSWSAATITGRGARWAKGVAGRPFFLFMNIMEPHYPYSAPPPFQHIDGPDIPYDMRLRQQAWQAISGHYNTTGEGLSDQLLSSAINQYDGETAYADNVLGEFFETLKREGLYDNTLIVLTADHGEFFAEHKQLDHRQYIYEEGVHVPLMVKYPKSAHAGEVKNERVSNMDVFATVFDALGLAVPAVTAQPLGKTTHPVVVENYASGAAITTLGARMNRTLTVIYSGDYKYIHSSAGSNELYNLARDPKEASNLVTTEGEVAARMEAAVNDWLARTPKFDGATSATKPMMHGGTPRGSATSSAAQD